MVTGVQTCALPISPPALAGVAPRIAMALPAVASVLLGGASVNKASILNVVVGTFLFQGILTMTPSVINSVLQTDMSEVIRIIVSNGMILYALTRKGRVRR